LFQFRRDSVIPGWRYETIFACREALRKQTTATVVAIEQARLDHVGISA
jgi:hypothetical protein